MLRGNLVVNWWYRAFLHACTTIGDAGLLKMIISITDRALGRIRSTASAADVDLTDTLLRIAVVPGGCSGLTYDLGWDTVVRKTDETLEIEGVRIVMDLKSRLYIDGSELDFSDGLDGKGYHFVNPNAVRTCACGESFGL